MSRLTVQSALILGSLGALALGAALLTFRPAAAPPAAAEQEWLDFAPDPAQRQRIAELEASLGPGDERFPKQARREPESAKLFMYMAGTSEKDAVVLAALDALRHTYSPRGSKKERPDRDLQRVLIKQLRSKSSARAQAAFDAAPVALMGGASDGELLATLLDLAAGEDLGLRWAALDSLDLMQPNQRPTPVLEAFLHATEGPAAFAVRGLRALLQSKPALDLAPEMKERARQSARRLFASPEPAVRGAALVLLVDLDPNTPGETADLARKSLTDPHPYLRGLGAAALSVGKLGLASDIHLLMPLVEDFAEALAALAGPAKLDGTPFELSSNVPGRRLVSESALFSVQRLALGPPPGPPGSEPTPPTAWIEPPTLTIGGRMKGLELVQANAAKMRAWYEAEKARIPRGP